MLKVFMFGSLALVTMLPAFGYAEPVQEARLLAGKVCELRTAIESRGADPFALRSVCKLETACDVLVQRLGCSHELVGAHELVEIERAMEDVTLFAERTTVTSQRLCRGNGDRRVAIATECMLAQLSRTQLVTDRFLLATSARLGTAHHGLGGHNTGSPEWLSQGAAGYGAFPPAMLGGLDVGRYRHSGGHTPLGGPRAFPDLSHFGETSMSQLGRGIPIPPSPGLGSCADSLDIRMGVDVSSAAGARSRGIPAFGSADRPRGAADGRGELGKAILGMLLSRMVR